MSRESHKILFGILFGVILIVAVYFLTIAKPTATVEVDSGYRDVMGTFARVIAVAADSKEALGCIEAAFAEIEKIDKLMSDYRNDSEISELNRDGFRRAVVVSKSTYEVLQRGIEFSELTSGAFDVTVGPLVDFWRSAAEANSLPTDAELSEARSKVGYELLYLDANETSVRFAVEGMRVDLGGIAKGYALDKAVEAMQKAGAVGGMVDIGGDVRCFGSPPAGQNSWRIGLQDPNKAKVGFDVGTPLLVLHLTDVAIATSGGYRRFEQIQGKKYSHIIDRKTRAGVEGLSSVTIISNNAIDADALATAVSVLGAEKGLALIEEIPETEAILITSAPQYKLIKTSDAEKYIK